jgi:hypothetical protein
MIIRVTITVDKPRLEIIPSFFIRQNKKRGFLYFRYGSARIRTPINRSEAGCAIRCTTNPKGTKIDKVNFLYIICFR